MLKFFYSPGSCALASQIALEDAGADYELIRLDFKAGEQRGVDYLAVNPKGRVPALVTGRGILTENPAILAFIAQSFPEAELAPLDDAFAFGELQAFNSYLCSTVHVAHAHGRRGSRWATQQSSFEDMQQKVPENMAACFGLIEQSMFKGPWVMGDKYTVADPYLFTIARWLEGDGVDVKEYPKVSDHLNRMTQLESVQRALSRQSQ
ncbi:glutathione S-transferase family protein [Rhizobium sp. KVB221]|uniref:Glutathione S-transferase family protein n=1 Tax=Rhizobium setariae TaxID=2801340 RepID=A0A936YLP7_9HYPH|nr:glutathione S-transferase family protein [Rhizobium setariae]MBL0370451.1 glutathione S-transferase family protein [Rhizobium setariae]